MKTNAIQSICIILSFAYYFGCTTAFTIISSTPSVFTNNLTSNKYILPITKLKATKTCQSNDGANHSYRETFSFSPRRKFFEQVAKSSLIMLSSGGLLVTTANAAETDSIIWKSGKQPIIPGKKTKDKNDVSGTRKDPDFLRSVATCKNQCENSYDKDGYARAKEECLSDCQDICCKTYEQCTFAIVPRI